MNQETLNQLRIIKESLELSLICINSIYNDTLREQIQGDPNQDHRYINHGTMPQLQDSRQYVNQDFIHPSHADITPDIDQNFVTSSHQDTNSDFIPPSYINLVPQAVIQSESNQCNDDYIPSSFTRMSTNDDEKTIKEEEYEFEDDDDIKPINQIIRNVHLFNDAKPNKICSNCYGTNYHLKCKKKYGWVYAYDPKKILCHRCYHYMKMKNRKRPIHCESVYLQLNVPNKDN